MTDQEQQIKDFAREQGVAIVGIAGPDRLDGPPSLDPTYTMKGARSIVSLVVPMDVDAIYKFLGKEAYTPHNADQTRMNTRMTRISAHIAGYIKSLGYRAEEVPANMSYRRSPDVFATHPSFSHRFGAIAAGIAAQGWSGNVMTEEFGASTYLGTVVTEAELKSDKPRYSPRHFIDDWCIHCRVCERTCVAGMFEPRGEEYVLLNGELHPRGKRRDIDLCNMSCFGLHSLSRDKKWTTWGTRWIKDWVDNEPDAYSSLKMRRTLLEEGGKPGDSTPRYTIIRQTAKNLIPEELVETYLDRIEEEESETERFKLLVEFANKIGVNNTELFKHERVLTCGQCALVCGPTVDEAKKRYSTLEGGGFVVPGPNNEVTVVDTYEKACETREKYMPKVSEFDKIKDGLASLVQWHKSAFGVEPKSVLQNFIYQRKLRKAAAEKGVTPG